MGENGRRLLWVGDTRGLLVFRPEQQRFFRLTDILPAPFYVHTLYRHAATGVLWAGTSDGVLKYNPQDNLIRTIRLPPALVRQPVQVNVITADRQDTTGQTFWLGLSHTSLLRWHRPPNQFTLIRYPHHAPETSGTDHRANYTNLSPGHYTLHLKAADSLGNWTHQPLRLTIDVLPAYYETWWFRGLMVILVVGSLYGVYRYWVNQLLVVQRICNRISGDLHDKIGSSLSGIGILGTIIGQNLPVGHPSGSMVARIVTEARQVSSSLDDIVWSINPRNDEVSSLTARMNRYAAELFESSGIIYESTSPDTIQQLTLPMGKRQDFYLIAKEAVNNLVKHARATHAQLAIRRDHQHLRLTISDNGVGFDTAVATKRNELRSMQTRAQHLHGQLTIDSAPLGYDASAYLSPVGLT